MRAVWYERTGPADDVLIAGEKPTPVAGPGEVRVKLMASGVNPADGNRRRGEGYVMEAAFVIPNSDGAGLVDQVGAGVTKHKVGDRVWLYNGQRNGRNCGTAAEYIALDADLVTALPDTVSFDAGAALGIPCMTAHRCVFGSGLVAGKTVLVTGGGGAVGNYAVQLAAWGGATVTATAGAGWQREDAITGGAGHVIERNDADMRGRCKDITGGRGFDRIIDVDFGGNIGWTKDVVALNGAISSYATRGNSSPVVPFRELMVKNATLQAVLLPTSTIEGRRQAQADILCWLQEGQRLHRTVGPFALADTIAAHKAVEAGGKRGTVVVQSSA